MLESAEGFCVRTMDGKFYSEKNGYYKAKFQSLKRSVYCIKKQYAI